MITYGAVAPALELKAALAAWIAANFGLTTATAKLRLFENNITPGLGTVASDLAETSFTGYAAKEILLASLGTPRLDASGDAYVIVSTIETFLQSGTAQTSTVYGWFLTDPTGATLIMAKRFPSPVVFDHTGKAIDMEVAFRVPVGGVDGGDDTTVSV